MELMIAMSMTLILLGIAATIFTISLNTRTRESSRTDALTAAQSALNVISREVSNSGYGLTSNGIVIADSNATRLHFRANIENQDLTTNSPGEDVTYYFDPDTESIMRYDPHDSPTTSVIINRISSVTFHYYDYAGASSIPTDSAVPTSNTGRVGITVTVKLENVVGQPDDQSVEFITDVNLRNSNYMLNQY